MTVCSTACRTNVGEISARRITGALVLQIRLPVQMVSNAKSLSMSLRHHAFYRQISQTGWPNDVHADGQKHHKDVFGNLISQSFMANSNGDLAEPSSKIGFGWEISSHHFLEMKLLTHALISMKIKLISLAKWGPYDASIVPNWPIFTTPKKSKLYAKKTGENWNIIDCMRSQEFETRLEVSLQVPIKRLWCACVYGNFHGNLSITI